MNAKRVLVVDDHEMMRRSIVSLLRDHPQFEVVGEAANGQEAVELAAALLPDLVLMDLRMPVLGGVEATAQVMAASGGKVRVLVFTTYDTDADIFRALEAGAIGYLLKDMAPEELTEAILIASEDGRPFSQEVAARLDESGGAISKPLTVREIEVLELVAAGKTNGATAARLHISEGTVKTHLLSIYRKLGVNDRAQMVANATSRGWLVSR
ncbi:MAG: response regulator transcription factor [Promicromonosporaceae bacterium]|nr:response regulator transcription factor [Promicromonosporaceae bacterium]